MNISDIIIHQINTLDPMAFYAWGTKELVKNDTGIRFKTSGLVKWKGYVHVSYDEGSDTYDLKFTKFRKNEHVLVKTASNVYFDQMIPVIDEQVG